MSVLAQGGVEGWCPCCSGSVRFFPTASALTPPWQADIYWAPAVCKALLAKKNMNPSCDPLRCNKKYVWSLACFGTGHFLGDKSHKAS